MRASSMPPSFVDPSRRAVEFRTDGSDETLRKSRWNETLVEQLLVPLLREVSTEVIDNAPKLIEQEPKKYLSLFPAAGSDSGAATCLADVVRATFCNNLWVLKLYDIWKESFDVWVGPDGSELELEKVPEWLGRYKAAFQSLTIESRRFIAWNVGDAVGERLAESGNIRVRKAGKDVADCVLLADQPPKPRDVLPLLKLLGEDSLNTADLEGRWVLQREKGDESLLRFRSRLSVLSFGPRRRLPSTGHSATSAFPSRMQSGLRLASGFAPYQQGKSKTSPLRS